MARIYEQILLAFYGSKQVVFNQTKGITPIANTAIAVRTLKGSVYERNNPNINTREISRRTTSL